MNAYVGHPHHLIIDNRPEPATFQDKLDRCLTQLNKIIGQPYDGSFNKAYLLNNYAFDSEIILNLIQEKIPFNDWRMWMICLEASSPGTNEYIQKRGTNNYTYCHIKCW